MTAPDAQPVQPPAPPPKPRGALGTNLVILCLLLGVSIGLWFVWWRPDKDSPNPHTGHEFDFAEPGEVRGNLLLSKQRMEKIAEALRNYREQFGDGVRNPLNLEDLKLVQLLPPDFEFTGLLSRRPLHYAPDVPANFDPTRWAICCDVEPPQRMHRGPRVPLAAVVILGDGSVRVLQGEELQKVGGIVYDQNAPR